MERAACEAFARTKTILAQGESIESVGLASEHDRACWVTTYLDEGKLRTETFDDDAAAVARMKALKAKGHRIEPRSGERVTEPGGPPFVANVIVRGDVRALRNVMAMSIPIAAVSEAEIPAALERLNLEMAASAQIVSFETDSTRWRFQLTCATTH
jgi:hypothetical protein